MMHISLFSGIGGFDLASEWMGWKNIASCEINEFGNKVLEHYWPDAYHHDDIHTFTYERLNDELTKRYGPDWRSDDIILTGGFPCQPYSAAGKRQGKEDDRHLWPQMLRVIREVRPKWVVGENVLGLVNWNGGLVFDEVQADLEAEGYQVQPYVLPAAGVGAPHRRDRVWFVAYARNESRRSAERCEDKPERELLSREQQGRSLWTKTSGCGGIGTTPDTDIGTTGSSRTSGGTQKGGSNEDIQPSQRGETPELDTGSHTLSQPTPDTNGTGLQEARPEQPTTGVARGGAQWPTPDTEGQGSRQLASEDRGRQDRRPDDDGTVRDAPDTSDQGLQRRSVDGSTRTGRAQPYEQPTRFVQPTWHDFPTQSPIRGRNDGVPGGLDGITVSKWRNESIKAYGNAIVPQVAYQIFKAIQIYESSNTP